MTLNAAGGMPGYTWSVASGTLPPNFNLSISTGQISSSNPMTPGTYSFTIQATDSASQSAAPVPFGVDVLPQSSCINPTGTPFVYNDNHKITYCGIWDSYTPGTISACTVSDSNQQPSSGVSFSFTNNTGWTGNEVLTATPNAAPGGKVAKCNYSGGGQAYFFFQVYDATPQITSIIHFDPPGSPIFVQGEGSVGVIIIGSNLGTGGTLCSGSGGVCGAGVTWTGPTTNWSPGEIDTVFLIDQTAVELSYSITLNVTLDAVGMTFAPNPQGGSQGSTSQQMPVSPPTPVVTQCPSFPMALEAVLGPSNPNCQYPLNMSTGDTAVITTYATFTSNGRQIPLSFTPVPSATLVPSNPYPDVNSYGNRSNNPFSTCAANLGFQNASRTGSANSGATAAAAGCSGIFTALSVASTTSSSNPTLVIVPPQVLVRQMHAEAGGFSGQAGQVAQTSVGFADVNRFMLSATPFFGGVSTYQGLAAQGNQIAQDGTDNGPPGIIDNAAAVFSLQIPDPTGNSACYWSPRDTETPYIMSALQSGQTTFPAGPDANGELLDPKCFCTRNQDGTHNCSTTQIVVSSSMPTNNQPGKTNSPAFMFERQRAASAPAVVQIP
jgi:hypothetical protein